VSTDILIYSAKIPHLVYVRVTSLPTSPTPSPLPPQPLFLITDKIYNVADKIGTVDGRWGWVEAIKASLKGINGQM
jgi:hypothetical protein